MMHTDSVLTKSLHHVSVLRLFVASTCLLMGGACRKDERYLLWPPIQSAGDKEAYVMLSSVLCSGGSVGFTNEQTETGTIEILAVGDGATRVRHRVVSQTDESIAGDGKRAAELGVLIGRDVVIERTGPQQWNRSLEGAPTDDDREREAMADTSAPYVGEPEDYPKKPVALHETWPVAVNQHDMKLTGTCSISKIDDIGSAKYSAIECTYSGSFAGNPLSSMTSREWVSLNSRNFLRSEFEADFNITKDGATFLCSVVILNASQL